MTKREILHALAHNHDDQMLLASVLDKLEACRIRNYTTNTYFLDMRQGALVREAVRLADGQDRCVFWGGYADAERVCAVFYPEYLTQDTATDETNSPVILLRAHTRGALRHADYLGALLGLQIERKRIGDILPGPDGAEILALRELEEFLIAHFTQAGRFPVQLTRVPLGSLRRPPARESEGTGSVASLRLDSVISLIFSLPRSQAQDMVEHGLVFVNQLPVLKPGRSIEVGDRITVRGKGRARVASLEGVSRKGRQFIRYVRTV